MNPKYHLLVAAAALSLSACSTDDTVTEPVTEPEKGGHKISFTIAENSETRTTLAEGDILQWDLNDRVGIYTVGQNGNTNILTFADTDQNPVEFSGFLDNSVSNGDMFYAYYPYNEAQSTDPAKVTLTIPADQMQMAAGEYYGQSQPLVAVPMAFSQELGSDYFYISGVKFRLLGAIVELQLFSSDEALHGEKIQSVKFESNTPLAGDFTFNLKTVTETGDLPITGYESKVAMTTLMESADIPAEDGKALVYLTIAPGTYTGRIVVQTDVAQYTFRMTEAMTFERAVIKGLPADLAGATREINPDAPIPFADPEVKRICVENWDTSVEGEEGKGELSYREAAAVTSIGDKFYSNKLITSFNELQYFTGLKSIGGNAFEHCNSLTSIHIPDGVTSIGGNAFSDCSSLTSIHIPDGVTTIEGWAFNGCSGLTSITIPAGVTKIEMFTFQNCSNLTSIQLQDGLTSIGDYAFTNCSSLTSINIPQTVTTFGRGVFDECSSLAEFEGECASSDKRCLILNGTLRAFAPADRTEYTIPDGVTAIGEGAFSGCSGLTSITIPDQVTSIGEGAFSGCSGLTSITIPDQVTSIGEGAFSDCSGLTSITIPDQVTSIENYAFSHCSGLTSITIPDQVTSIGEGAFSGCSGLTSITIPDQVTSIGEGVFSDCSGLTSITIPNKVASIGYSAFINCSSLESINIPEGVTTIEDSTFEGCSKLTSINIQTRVKEIGNGAFKGCIGLTSITIPDGVTKIGSYAFDGCSGLKSINIPDGVTEIGGGAFFGCSSLESITIPAGVTEIRYHTFTKCSKLTSVYCKPTDPPTLGSNAFLYTPSSLQIYVPATSVDAYKTATDKGWIDYADQIVADNSSTGK